MYRKEVNAQSPLRILERSIHGGLGKGNLGVVMARAGVGKTAFLVQIGLDDLMQEKDVLHVALGQSLGITVIVADTMAVVIGLAMAVRLNASVGTLELDDIIEAEG